jgi:hypothetical protein
MELFVYLAPALDRAVDLPVGSVAAVLAALVVALVPLMLVVRHAVGFGSAEAAAPQLRVIEGRKELGRRAA